MAVEPQAMCAWWKSEKMTRKGKRCRLNPAVTEIKLWRFDDFSARLVIIKEAVGRIYFSR